MSYFQKWPRPLLILAMLALVFAVAFVDLHTGELSFFVFYFVPVSFAAWTLNLSWAVVAAFLCTVGWLGVEWLSGHTYSHGWLLVANTLIRWFSYTLIGYFFSSLRESRRQLRAYANELEDRVAQRTMSLEERVAELEMFSYSVSHNLRAPLRAIEGLSHAIEERVSRDSEARDHLRRIQASAIRMDRLVLDLVDYVQLTIREADIRPIALGPLLSEVLGILEARIADKNAKISIQGELPVLLGQNRMLHAVLFQLVSNALKFGDPGRRPVIDIAARHRPSGFVQVRVSDNGIGISESHQERIFGMFEQLHPYDVYGGTGMGLAIARKCVQKMGGRIGVESREGEGSTFWFELKGHRAVHEVASK